MAADARQLDALFETIVSRKADDPASSYTARLVAGGAPLCARKLGEEAVETVVAALSADRAALVAESADLLYHWLVLLAERGVEPSAVYAELARREGRSGIEEKASRGTDKTGGAR